MFGVDRALEALSRAQSPEGAGGLVDGLEKAVTGFVGGAPQSDDITVLALRYHGRTATALRAGWSGPDALA